MRDTYLNTKVNYDCSGCGACKATCTHKAITMESDFEGFLYPIIDNQRCIHCDLCRKICPILSDMKNEPYIDQKALIVRKTEKKYYFHSATLGIATILSELIIKNGGCVFGAELIEQEWKVRHICIDSLKELDRIRNSKYLQSDTVDTFFNVKRKLLDGQFVLYIGTACQIAGLKSYLRKRYKNLLTIDLICHGTFSFKMMQREVAYWENKLDGKLFNFRFRNKKLTLGGVVDFDIRLNKNGKTKHITRFAQFSPVYRLFTAHGNGIDYNLRPSCYKCAFRAKERYGDITLGDPWGIKQYHPELYTQDTLNTGIALLFANTPKGMSFVEKIRNYAKFDEIPLEQAFSQPALLCRDDEMPAERAEIYKCTGEDLGSLVERVLHINFDEIYKSFIKKQRKIRIIIFIKKLLHIKI